MNISREAKLAFSPMYFCFGLCFFWKAFASVYTVTVFSNSLLQIIIPAAALLIWSVTRTSRTPYPVVWASALIGMLATVVLGFAVAGPLANTGASGIIIATTSVIIFGVYALFFLFWAEMYVLLDITSAGLAISGSYVIGSLGYFLLRPLDPMLCFGIACCLPFLSGWSLVLSRKQAYALRFAPQTEEQENPAPAFKQVITNKLFPWHIIIVISAFTLAAGICRSDTSTSDDLFAVGLAGGLFVLFILATVLAHTKINIYLAYRTIFFIMTISLLAGMLLGDNPISAVLIRISHTLSSIALVLFLCDCSNRFKLPTFPVVAFARTCTSAAFLIGTLIGTNALFGLKSDTFVVPLIYGLTAVIIIIASYSWLRGTRDSLSSLDMSDHTSDISLNLNSLSPNNQPADSHTDTNMQPDASTEIERALQTFIEIRSNHLAQEYGLSKRETDVLLLLAWGKSAKRIEEILTLSSNTVKTHVRHIYAKLGIHSRAELDALLYEDAPFNI